MFVRKRKVLAPSAKPTFSDYTSELTNAKKPRKKLYKN